MRRIYYLTQTAVLASEVFLALDHAGVILKNFSVVSDDKEAIKEHGLKEANIFQRKDITRYIELGALGGLMLGLVAALITVIVPPKGVDITPLTFITEVFLLGFFGLSIGFLLGVSKDNFYISEFRDQLDRKEFILLVDVEDQHYKEISGVMSTQFSHVIKLKEEPSDIPLLVDAVDRAA